MTDTNPPAASGIESLPLFYRRPEIVDPARHSGLAVMPLTDFGFARASNSVPVTVEEFFEMALAYPIVFTRGEVPAPVVVVGLGGDTNLFLDEAGRWARGQPVPAYVRRYPFILFEAKGADRLPLCIDRAAAVVVEAGAAAPDGAQLLFDGEAPTSATKHALAFCEAYQRQLEATRGFARLLADAGLLIEQQVALGNAAGVRHAMDGFMIVDEAKFNALSDEQTLVWKKNGALAAVYAHLLSQRNWPKLAERADAKPPAWKPWWGQRARPAPPCMPWASRPKRRGAPARCRCRSSSIRRAIRAS